jgi:hypothetical protein
MGNGQQPTALEQAAYVPDVKPDFREQFVQGAAATAPRGTDLDALSQQMAQHHQQRLDEARMHKQNLAQAGALLHYGINPATNKPLTPEERQRYMNEYNAAKQAYMKVAGVNKQTKEALNKAFTVMDHMIGPGAQNQQGPPQTGGFTPSPQAQQAAPTASPQDQAIAAEGAGSTAAQPSAAPGGGGPPPLPFEVEAPFMMEQLQYQQAKKRAFEAQSDAIEQRQGELKKLNIDPNSLIGQEYALTGKLTYGVTRGAGKFTQGPYMEDPEGNIRKVLLSPDGQYVDPITHQPITEEWKNVSASNLITRTVNIMGPSGIPEVAFRQGDTVYDHDENGKKRILGQLIPFSPRMLNRETDREVWTQNTKTGEFERQILRSATKVNVPGMSMGVPPASTVQGQPAATPSGPPSVTPQTTAPAGGAARAPAVSRPKTAAASRSQDSTSLLEEAPASHVPAGQANVLAGRAGGVFQASSALVGSDDELKRGEIGGLAADLDVFKNPDSVKRISEYLDLVSRSVSGEGEKAAGAGWGDLIKWWGGLPQTIVGLEQGALRDKANEIAKHPDEQKFISDYFRVMGTFPGIRNSTGLPSTNASYATMRNEMPTPGVVTDYDQAVDKLANYVAEANNAARLNPYVGKVRIDKLRSKLGYKAPPKKSGGPPAPASKTDTDTGFKPF